MNIRLSHAKKLVRKPVVIEWQLADTLPLDAKEIKKHESEGHRVALKEVFEDQAWYDLYTPAKYRWDFVAETA